MKKSLPEEIDNIKRWMSSEEAEKKYLDGLTHNYGRTKPYQYNGPKCTSACKPLPHYETHHAPDCPFYPGSMSEKYDEMERKLKSIEI
jgi:hypothetical protein